MKKALVLGVMAIFAMNIVNAQVTVRTAAPQPAQDEKNEKFDKGQAPVAPKKQAKPFMDSKNNMGNTANSSQKGTVNLGTVTIDDKASLKDSKDNMGTPVEAVEAGKTTLKDSKDKVDTPVEAVEVGKTTLRTESKNNMGVVSKDMQNGKITEEKDSKEMMPAVEESKTVGKTTLGTAKGGKQPKLSLKPRTIKENKPDAVKNSKNAINR